MLWIFCLLLLLAGSEGNHINTLTERYVGCYEAAGSGDNTFAEDQTFADNGIHRCIIYCRGQQYTFAGLQDGSHCLCGHSYYAKQSYRCWNNGLKKCPGKPTEVCGGENGGTSVYHVCGIGIYGANCERSCSCEGRGCYVNGTCLNECPAGKQGAGCTETCPDSKFGPDCAHSCSSYCEPDNCHPISGHCTEGCPSNAYGPYCRTNSNPGGNNNPTGPCPYCAHCRNSVCEGSGVPGGWLTYHKCPSNWSGDKCKACNDGRWGSRCEYTCPNCATNACSQDNGNCIGDCKAGYYGSTCSQPCPEHCANNICTQNGNTCTDGCTVGFRSADCSLPCPESCGTGACSQNDYCIGCPSGKHGQTCSDSCSPNCASGTCLQSNGHCNGGCKPGYHGQTCSQSCPGKCALNICAQTGGTCPQDCELGYHGSDCSDSCPNNCAGNRCSKDTGHCVSCPSGKHGQSCSDSCPQNCASNTCSKDNGYCNGNCNSGYHGSTCSDPCPENCAFKTCSKDNGNCISCLSGFHGSNCSKPCSEHCISDTCSRNDGSCHGCLPGYYKSTCSERCPTDCGTRACSQYGDNCIGCPAGFFRRTCSETCPGYCTSGNCVQDDGTCAGNCKAGYHGGSCDKNCAKNCDQKGCDKMTERCIDCDPGFYGDKCESRCGNCSAGFCDRDAGHCSPCNPGYYGSKCTEICPPGCDGLSCAQDTAVCSTGCVSGSYSPHCNLTCSAGCLGSCERTDAACLACKVGFQGSTCTEKCPEGCSGGCDQFTGRCKKCTNGFYGSACDQNCSTCTDGLCGQDSGLCRYSCQDGMCGGECDVICKEQATDGTCNQTTCKNNDSVPIGGNTAPWVAGTAVGVLALLVAIAAVVILSIGFRRNGLPSCECGIPCIKRSEKPMQLDHPLPTPLATDLRTPKAKEQTAAATTTETEKPKDQRPKAKEKPKLKVKPTVAAAAPVVAQNGKDPAPEEASADSLYYNVIILNARVRKQELKEYIATSEEKRELEKQYKRLKKGKAHPWSVAESEENMAKNRYKGILAYDHSRVVLQEENPGEGDYMNANYINGYQQEKAFIASQGVTEQNINEFWRMIWQEQVSTIVVVTKLAEGKKVKTLPYWPKDGGKKSYGTIEVTLLEEKTHYQYVTRKIHAKKGDIERTIHQFHFLGWPDHDVPDSPTSLVNFWHVVKAHTQTVRDKAPVLVHCSAGIGRTGTYISLDWVMAETADGDYVDLLGCVDKLRKDRVDMVQNVLQYKFLYHAVYEAIFIGKTLLGKNQLSTEQQLKAIEVTKQLTALDDKNPFEADAQAIDERGDEDSDWNIQVFKVQGMGPDALEIRNPNGSGVIYSQAPDSKTCSDLWDMIQKFKCNSVVLSNADAKKSAWMPTAEKSLSLAHGMRVSLQPSANKTPPRIVISLNNPADGNGSAEYANVDVDTSDECTYVNVGDTPTGGAEESTYMNTEEARKEVAAGCTVQLLAVDNAMSAENIVQTWKTMQRGKNHAIVSRSTSSELGVFAVSCVLLDIMSVYGEVDVFSTVRQLRPHFIQDLAQYQLLHRVLYCYCQDQK